jgi:ABC-2 type transport system ATP-binding protein
MSILLEIQHLKKQFATHLAVNDISFTLQKGSIFGLLGPNGAGKTTLIRMITGIFHPDQGKIMMNGKVYHPEKDPSRIGYMPDE